MLGLMPQSLYTCHAGQAGGRGLSPRIWARVAGQSLSPDGLTNGFLWQEDFLSFGGTVTTNVGTYSGGFKSYEDTGGSIAQIVGIPGGAIKITTDGTDNDEMWMQTGYSAGTMVSITDTAGSEKLVAFEARVRFTQVGNTYNAFIGLSEEGLAAADTVTDAGALASKDLIGFAVLEADGDALSFVYRKAGAAVQTVLTTAIAADTWYDIGFIYDPKEVPSKRIKIFIDNVEQSTYVTATNIAAATFPDGESLAVLAGVKNGSAAASRIDIDRLVVFGQG